MKLPPQISFHNLDRSESIEGRIIDEASQLDEFCGRIMSCRVVVDMLHRRHATGNLYQVRLDIKVPGEEIAVTGEPTTHDPYYEDVNVAIRDAFSAAARKLDEYTRRERRDVKQHSPAPHGRVSKLFAESGYGFIETPDGGQVYFHANSVLGDKFHHLTIGTEVAFAEELGDRGQQASSVRVLRSQHQLA